MGLLAGLWLAPAAALAARELNDFKPPAEMTPEELEASKARSRLPVNAYSKGVTDKVSPIPWKTILLFTIALAIVTPYAVRYYRATAGESESAKKRAPSPPRTGTGKVRAFDETKVRNVGVSAPQPRTDDTRVPVRRNTRP